MKSLYFILFTLILSTSLSAQTIQLSDKLTLIQLTDKTYIHSCEGNNGLIFINGKKALIVSTPDSDPETQNLIDWVKKEKGAKIVAYVIDRWHPDAMEGLDIVQKNGIKSYASELTRQIAKEKGLPVAQVGFDPKIELKVGNEKVICHYLGEAHTKDGIVVWIPDERILFGGNEIRNYNGWVGNIGNASLDKWSDTAGRIKKEYGSAKIVIPGHGKYGGPELIDYTIQLYKDCKNMTILSSEYKLLDPTFITDKYIFTSEESDSINEGNHLLKNAIVVIQDSSKYVEIKSPLITWQPDKKRVKSETGNVKIYDKVNNSEVLRTNVNYNKLIVYPYDETIRLVVILKDIVF